MAATFLGAKVGEIRVYEDPSNPGQSGYNVILPITETDAVVDKDTGESVVELLGKKADTSAMTTALAAKQSTSAKGTANGYAGLDGNSKVPAANLPGASNAAQGIVQLSTDAEATAGTVETKAVNPKQLKTGLDGKQSTSAKNAANGYAGLDANAKVPAANLPSGSSTAAGIMRLSTDAEASAGTLETVGVNPKQLKTALVGVSVKWEGIEV